MSVGARPAMRGHLARFVAVLAVLAGLALAVGLQCTDGTAAMPMDMAGAAVECGSPSMVAEQAGHHVVDPCLPADASGASGFDGLGGVLATCLAFIIAVVAAAVLLRPLRASGVFKALQLVRVSVFTALRPRAPSLAELCLLRT
jgi:hypothetical protein